MQKEIYHLRLTNGDEIIGHFLGESERQGIVIKTPMSMADSPHRDGSGLILTRYTSFDENEVVEFRSEHVISVNPVIDEMAEYYNLSVRYTDRIAQRMVKDELKEVNSTLRALLFNVEKAEELVAEGKLHPDEQKIIYIPEANTLH